MNPTTPQYQCQGESITVIFNDITPGAKPSKGDRYLVRHEGDHMWKIERLQDFPKGKASCGHIRGLENVMAEILRKHDERQIEKQKAMKGNN